MTESFRILYYAVTLKVSVEFSSGIISIDVESVAKMRHAFNFK